MNKLLEKLKSNHVEMIIKESYLDNIVCIEFKKDKYRYATEISWKTIKSSYSNIEFAILNELDKFLNTMDEE